VSNTTTTPTLKYHKKGKLLKQPQKDEESIVLKQCNNCINCLSVKSGGQTYCVSP